MDGQTSSPPPPPPSSSAGPLWRLGGRRSRKAGAGNIFMGVNLHQLQRLFRAAGDQDAERRAQLVWGGGDEAELAHALVGLRTRGRRRGLRGEGRSVLGSHWLRAFNHLRIGESSSSRQSRNQGPLEEAGVKPETPSWAPGPLPGPSSEGQGPAGAPETAAPARGDKGLGGAPETAAPARGGPGLKRAGDCDTERYLHRIIH